MYLINPIWTQPDYFLGRFELGQVGQVHLAALLSAQLDLISDQAHIFETVIPYVKTQQPKVLLQVVPGSHWFWGIKNTVLSETV